MNTFVITYSPTDNVNLDGAVSFFGNDIAVFGQNFVEALDHLQNPSRCPLCMSKEIDYTDPLMPVCKVCGVSGTLNKFQPAVNVLTHVVLEEPVEPGGRQFFIYENLAEARKDFEEMMAEMALDMELIFDSIKDKQSFWNGLLPDMPKGGFLCVSQ